jgi:WD40 repeat protein
LWDAASGEKLQGFQGHAIPVQSATFSPDGRQVRTICDYRTVIAWDATSGKKRTTFRVSGDWQSQLSVVLSPDGRLLLSECIEPRGAAVLWDVAAAKKLHVLEGHADYLSTVGFSPDGQLLVTGGYDDKVVLWDAATAQRRHTLEGHKGLGDSAAFSPDGRLLLTSAHDAAAILWDVATGKEVRRLQRQRHWIDRAAFGPKGKQVATLSRQSVFLWDVDTGNVLREFEPPRGGCVSASMSPDGKLLLAAVNPSYGPSEVILWDIASGERLRTLAGHTRRLGSAAFSPDGRQIVTASYDGTTRIWDPATGKELVRLLSLDGGREWLAATPDGYFHGSPKGCRRVTWRVGNEVFPVDKYEKEFHRPEIIARSLAHDPGEQSR